MGQKNYSYLLLISIVSAMGGLLFGYDWVVIGGAKIFYEPFFGLDGAGFAAMRGWAMSSALLGCLVGAVASGATSDRYGRRKLLILASVLFTLSAYGTGAVDSFTWFIIFRIIGGLGIGIASTISPIYIAEVSPSSIRGKLVSLNQLSIVVGILMAQIANWAIGDYFTLAGQTLNETSQELAWRYMFWSELVLSTLFFVLSFIIPESPRWLAINGQRSSAQAVFTKIGGEAFASESLKAIDSMPSGDKLSLKELLKPCYRKTIIVGVVLSVLVQWCGINVIFNYAHEVFAEAGYAVSDVLMNIVVTGTTNLIFTFVAIFTIDRWGRKTLMNIGSLGLFIIFSILGLSYYLEITGLPMLILIVVAIGCYAMTLAPTFWVIVSEIFPNRIRGVAMAISTFFLWVASFLLTYTFPILNETFGAAGTFWAYGLVCLTIFLFVRTNLKETMGKSLEEIEQQNIEA